METILSSKNPNGLSEECIIEIINEFIRDNPVEVIYPQLDSSLYRSILSAGGAGFIEASYHNISQYKQTGDISDISYGSESKNTPILVIIPREFTSLKCKEDLIMILRHEYGHIKTHNQLTQNDWWEYLYKLNLIQKAGLVLPRVNIFLNAKETSSLAASYYHLKPEKYANDYSGIDYSELIKIITGIDLENDWVNSKFYNLIEFPVSDYQLKLFQKHRDNGVLFGEEELDFLTSLQDFYRQCYPEEAAAVCIDALEETIQIRKRVIIDGEH